MKSRKIVLLSFGLLAAVPLSADPAWEAHGKLEVSPNGHYIQHADDTPFLWIGDTGWGMFQQLTREEVDLYLDNRAALGFNVIQSVAHWSPHGGGIDRSPDNAANAYGHRPFAGSEQVPDTAAPLLVEGGSAAAPNDYWDHADYIVQAVKERGMYLALLPCWGSELITNTHRYDESQAKAYGAFLGKRYGAEPHVIWVLGGDTKAQFKGYNKLQKFEDYDNRAIFRAMAEGLAEGATGQGVAWNQTSPVWDELFITYHPNGDYPYGSSQWFHHDAWFDANGVEVWKEVDDVYRAMLDGYQLDDPVKPSLFLEGSYEYGTYRHECGWVTPLRVRRQLYHTFFAGGAAHTYGAAPIWAMRGSEGDYNCGYTLQQALDFPGAFQVATIAKEFLNEHDWHEWVPDGTVVNYVDMGDKLKCAVTSRAEDKVLVYFSNNSQAIVHNRLDAVASTEWFYPRDGRTESEQSFQPGESRTMAPPLGWEDAVLVLYK